MLILVTSYPKSGNTWMRRFLCSYITGAKVALDDLFRICPIIYHPGILKETLGLDFTDDADKKNLPFIMRRPEIYRKFHEHGKGANRIYLKTHAANVSVNGVPQNTDEYVFKYVYLVRHPLDVIPSYAHHMGLGIPETWAAMKQDAFMTRRDETSPCWEMISSWERHTRSWLELASSPKMLVVRYEDMKYQPIKTFRRVLDHLELKYQEARFAKALHWADFETMKQDEEKMEGGYVESTDKGNFFRKGEIGDGSKTVPEEIQREIRTAFPDLMRVLGYE